MSDSPALRRRPRLIAEVAFFVACKLFIIFCLWWFFFSPSHRTAVTPEKMSNAIFHSAPAGESSPAGRP